MSGIAITRNIGAFVTLRPGISQGTLLAAGTGDNTTINGTGVDRTAIDYPLSAVLATFFYATLQSGATLTLTTKIQDSADNSAWSDFATEAAGVVATGQSGGGAVSGTHELMVDLSGARKWVRGAVLPDLSAAGTDTGIVVAALAFGGGNHRPATL